MSSLHCVTLQGVSRENWCLVVVSWFFCRSILSSSFVGHFFLPAISISPLLDRLKFQRTSRFLHDSRQVLHRIVDTLEHVWRYSSIVVFMQWCILCRRHGDEELDYLSWDCSLFRFLGLLENLTWLVSCSEQGWWLVFGGVKLWQCSFLAVLDIW